MKAVRQPAGIVVLGAGYHAKLVVEYLRLGGQRPVAILDDDPGKHGTRLADVPVTGPIGLLPDLRQQMAVSGVALGVGNIRLRGKMRELYDWTISLGLEMVSVRHPSAVVSASARIASGFFAGPLSVVNTDAQLGRNVTIYTGATIDHDSVVGDHVFISPGVHTAGRVVIESGVYLGPGAIIGSECRVGAGSIVGAGAVVLENVPPGSLVAGVPARRLKSVAEWERARQ